MVESPFCLYLGLCFFTALSFSVPRSGPASARRATRSCSGGLSEADFIGLQEVLYLQKSMQDSAGICR